MTEESVTAITLGICEGGAFVALSFRGKKRVWAFSVIAFLGQLREFMQLWLDIKAAEIGECEQYDFVTGDRRDIITDSLGNWWSSKCPECGKRSMEVVRPGKVQCSKCK